MLELGVEVSCQGTYVIAENGESEDELGIPERLWVKRTSKAGERSIQITMRWARQGPEHSLGIRPIV